MSAGQADKSGEALYAHERQHLSDVTAQPKSPHLQLPMLQPLANAKMQLKPMSQMSVAPIGSVSNIGHAAHAVEQMGREFQAFVLTALRDLNLLLSAESRQKIFDAIHNSSHKVKIQELGYLFKRGGAHKALARLDPKISGVSSAPFVPQQTAPSVFNSRAYAQATSWGISFGHQLIHFTHLATGKRYTCESACFAAADNRRTRAGRCL